MNAGDLQQLQSVCGGMLWHWTEKQVCHCTHCLVFSRVHQGNDFFVCHTTSMAEMLNVPL